MGSQECGLFILIKPTNVQIGYKYTNVQKCVNNITKIFFKIVSFITFG